MGKEYAYNAGDTGSTVGWEDSLEEEMATHSSILAWKILWTEEPGGLQYMGHKELDTAERRRHTLLHILIPVSLFECKYLELISH